MDTKLAICDDNIELASYQELLLLSQILLQDDLSKSVNWNQGAGTVVVGADLLSSNDCQLAFNEALVVFLTYWDQDLLGIPVDEVVDMAENTSWKSG